MEIWKQIENYPDYFVSNLGRVKSLKRGGEKVLKGALDKDGYHFIILCNGNRKKFFIHRLVGLVFLPNPENKPQINHKDRNKTNNCLSNLEWSTASENTKHAYDNGLENRNKGKKLGGYNAKVYRFFTLKLALW